MKHKISFLMAAHNEEKIIEKALERLVKVHEDYPEMEVLIGLDGCIDNTLGIITNFSKKYKFFRYIELNERNGKQAVLEKLEPHITGDIIIIHDADWSFVYSSKKDLIEYISLFDNPKIGGIADSISSEFCRDDFKEIKSMGFLASAWGNHFLIDYIKNKFTEKKENYFVYNLHKMKFFPFLDVYRKEAMKKTKHREELRAGDHVERTLRIINAGYEVIAFDNPNWPHFMVNYNKQSVKDLINQKVRGIVAKKKIQSSYNVKIPFFGFYVPFLSYVVINSFKTRRLRDFTAIYIYLFVMFYSISIAKIKQRASVKEIWNLRVKR